MIPAHQFSQIPTAYYYSLIIDDREKAFAFVEYAIDEFNTRYTADDHMQRVREYMRRWRLKHPSAAQRWIEDFRLQINKFQNSCIFHNNKNVEKTKSKKAKKSGTTLEQSGNKFGTNDTCKRSMETEFNNENWNTSGMEMEQSRNGLTIYKEIEKEIVGGEERQYLEFRLSGQSINNPTGLEITILRDLQAADSKESKKFRNWQKIKILPILNRIILDFASFGSSDRKICQEIFDDYKKDVDPKDLHFTFEIAFFEAKNLISKRSRSA